jgi:uncharacterized protein (TIGR03067 family)
LSPLLLTMSLVVGAPALKDKPNPSDLIGEWEFVRVIDDGKERPPEKEPTRYRFNSDGTWQIFNGGKETASRRPFSFDPKASPPTLDFNQSPTGSIGPNDVLVLSIYQITGDKLIICDAAPMGTRPDVLVSPHGSGRYLVHLRRLKPID